MGQKASRLLSLRELPEHAPQGMGVGDESLFSVEYWRVGRFAIVTDVVLALWQVDPYRGRERGMGIRLEAWITQERHRPSVLRQLDEVVLNFTDQLLCREGQEPQDRRQL